MRVPRTAEAPEGRWGVDELRKAWLRRGVAMPYAEAAEILARVKRDRIADLYRIALTTPVRSRRQAPQREDKK